MYVWLNMCTYTYSALGSSTVRRRNIVLNVPPISYMSAYIYVASSNGENSSLFNKQTPVKIFMSGLLSRLSQVELI